MSEIQMLFGASLLTVVAALLLSSLAIGRWLVVALFAAQLYLLTVLDLSAAAMPLWSYSIMGHTLLWQFDALSWLFALATIGAGLFAGWYGAGDWSEKFAVENGSPRLLYLSLSVNVLFMLVLLASADLLSLFIGWELVSWAGVLLMLFGDHNSRAAAMRYITYAFAGGMAVLAAIVLINQWTGSLAMDALSGGVANLSAGQWLVLVLLLVGGFAVKMGLMPMHLWQAPAYAYTTGTASAFLGAISARMGLFAIALVVFKLLPVGTIANLSLAGEWLNLRTVLAWLAAFTVILPTFTALRQNDARLLLAWHGIGQGGYMLLGLLMFDSMGSAGGLMHMVNHAVYQAALLMSVFGIVYRTGTADLNRLGGLVARMPLSFLVMLISIIGLAGLPPMNGFVSKWMIYRALLNEGMPLLFVASVIGTLGTILSVYKLIHNSFLGQLRVEHEHVSEVPWSMMLPMLLLATIVFVTGAMPGLLLEYVAQAQLALGMTPVNYTLGGVLATEAGVSGDLDMLWVVGILFAGFGIGAVLFLSTGKSRRVHQLDNYAGGHFLTAENQYQYSDNFYAGLMHVIKPWYRGSFTWFEKGLISFMDAVSGLASGFYRQAHVMIWLVAVVTLLIGGLLV